MFDFRKLRGRIVEKFSSQKSFANAMSWSERTLSLKLNGKISWTQRDITKASEILDISTEEIIEYFFCIKSSKI